MYTNNTIKPFATTDDERLIAPLAPSPFANLEYNRIKNACTASRNMQIKYDKIAHLAHAIIYDYYSGHPLVSDEETAITLLCRYCKRNRAIAKQNIANSKYAYLVPNKYNNNVPVSDALFLTNLLEETLLR